MKAKVAYLRMIWAVKEKEGCVVTVKMLFQGVGV